MDTGQTCILGNHCKLVRKARLGSQNVVVVKEEHT